MAIGFQIRVFFPKTIDHRDFFTVTKSIISDRITIGL